MYDGMQGYRVPAPRGTTTPRPEWARPPSTQSSNDELPAVIETTRKPTTTEKPTKRPTAAPTKPSRKPTQTTTMFSTNTPKPTKKPSKKPTTTRSTTTTTTTTEKYVEPEFPEGEEEIIEEPSVVQDMNCADSSNTEAYFADPNNCKNFYRCNQNEATKFECKDKLVFNPRINTCDWPTNVPNCKNFYLKDNDGDVEGVSNEEIDGNTVEEVKGNLDEQVEMIEEEKKTEADNEIDEFISIIK